LKQNYALLLIVLFGAVVRLYNLGTPSLWADEMQVVFGMQMPLGALWEWIARHEVHPPLFHLLMKIVALTDVSDSILRLPWALCGIASIPMIYVLGKQAHSEGAGLFGAALLASNPLHIWLSRMVRPYTLLILLCLGAYICLLHVLKEDNKKNWIILYILNGIMLLLHLNALLIVGSQGAILLAACALKKVSWRRFLQFSLVSVACFIPSTLVFITATTRADMIAPFTYWDAWQRSLYNLAHAADHHETGWLTWAVWGACAAGAVRLALNKRWESLSLAALVILPVAAVVLRKYASYYNPWHVSYMLPVILTFAGVGVAWILGNGSGARFAAPGVAAGLILSLSITLGDRLFGQDAVIITWYDPANFKTLAKNFPDTGENTLVSFDEAFIAGGTTWYLNQYRAINPIESMSLLPGRTRSRLVLFSRRQDFDQIQVAGNRLLGAQPSEIQKIDTQNIWTLEYERLPVMRINALPFSTAFDMNPPEILGRAQSLKDLTLQYAQGWKLHPTRHESTGAVEFEFENQSGQIPQQISLAVPFRNAGTDNILTMSVGFDDQQPSVVASSRGPDLRQLLLSTIERSTPYKKLRVRLEATCARTTPEYVTGGLESITLDGLRLSICQPSNDGPCSVIVKGWLEEMLRGMNLGSQFTDSHPGQRLSWRTEDISEEQSSEYPQWHVLKPKNSAQEVVVRVSIDRAGGDFTFYPRVGGQSFVTARIVLPGKDPAPIFNVPGGDGIWTPISARYPLSIPNGAELEIILKGPWAQLWMKDGNVIFNR
jgi:4-amino-4-deoxy-L-arabinose transferase-like glycosyltransferase